MTRTAVAVFTFLFLLCLSVACGTSREATPSRELPMELHDGFLIVVEGHIANLHNLKFVLDTGSTFTIIDRKIADILELARSTPPGHVVNFDRTLRLESGNLSEIGFGPELATTVRTQVADLRYFRAIGVKVDAVIGLDLLARDSFRLDFAKKRVLFGLPPSDSRGVPLRRNAICLTVEIDLEGRHVPMVVDTGMPGISFYEDRLASLTAAYRVEGHTTGRSIGGVVESKVAFLPPLRLGTQDLSRRVYLVSSNPSSTLGNVAGNLGLSSLHAKQIDFDFENQELRWK